MLNSVVVLSVLAWGPVLTLYGQEFHTENTEENADLELWVPADIQGQKVSLWEHHVVCVRVCVLPLRRLNQLTDFQKI
jgi:hypothetical protein